MSPAAPTTAPRTEACISGASSEINETPLHRKEFIIAAHCAPAIDPRTGAPAADVKVFVCGPPPMYAALCGARDDPAVSGVLAEMGYTSEQVVKF